MFGIGWRLSELPTLDMMLSDERLSVTVCMRCGARSVSPFAEPKLTGKEPTDA